MSKSAGEPGLEVDVAVIGAGAAGLWTALVAAEAGVGVALVSRSPLAETASYWAQGGLAAALAKDDSPQQHAADTLKAGRKACRTSAVDVLCTEAPLQVAALRAAGVGFDLDANGDLALGLEGGHSKRRIVHAGGSSTGRRITRELSARVANHERIRVLEGLSARGLLRGPQGCGGVVTDELTLRARATVLATGGTAALWLRTTNPPGATGTGIALAHTAGAAIADLEMVQFHPTALHLRGRKQPPRFDGFLVSEAVRGEGATLHDAAGDRFVDELAPRDEVARAIQRRCREDGRDFAELDMRGVDPGRFPNIVTAIRGAGFDPAVDLIPVSPAAHYVMGGIVTDLDGHTTLPGLYAVGECACTGLHGANRLASNSLSECFAFGSRGGRAAAAAVQNGAQRSEAVAPVTVPEPVTPTAETKAALWRHAGLERDQAGLTKLLDSPHALTRLIARSALSRQESRGVHWRIDFPNSNPELDLSHIVIEAHELESQFWD